VAADDRQLAAILIRKVKILPLCRVVFPLIFLKSGLKKFSSRLLRPLLLNSAMTEFLNTRFWYLERYVCVWLQITSGFTKK
jgi:hypothetical protein